MLFNRLEAGDVRFIMRGYARDARLVFPGDSSFGGDHRGKERIEAWIERFAALGPRFVIHEVAVAGPPWHMRIFFRFTDNVAMPGGGQYENHGAELVRIRWGKIREQRVYADTQKIAKFDEQLELAGASA